MYKNKKNQAPSYCDRILFKNNTVYPYTINIYGCLDNLFGSDHRPVYLSLNIKAARDDEVRPPPLKVTSDTDTKVQRLMDFTPPWKFMDINLCQIMQNYGSIDLKYLRITNFKLPTKIAQNIQTEFKKMNPSDRITQHYFQHFQISFYADFINDLGLSSEISMNYSEDDNARELCWEESQIPVLHTPVNNLELLKNKRIVIIVWYLDEFTTGWEVAGQLNVPMFGFT